MKKKNKVFSWFKKEQNRIFLSLGLFLPGFVLEKFGLSIPSMVFLLLALIAAGFPVVCDAVRGLLHRDFLDEKFLMSIASLGAVVLGEYSEAAAVMIFYLIGEAFEHRAVRKSRDSIRSLMDICPDEATVLHDGKEERVDAEEVPVGSTIIVRTGERVPLDCVVLSGSADLDTSALTGESIPRSVSPSETVESGTVVLSGVLTCKTLRLAEESAAARVLELVENANERKSREENFITKFSHIYTPAVVIGAVLLAVLPPVFKVMPFAESVSRALIFLVVSCPCALVISVPLAFFGGIGCAASRGLLFKGGNTFAPLARAEVFCFDKTGTLTTGEFSVADVRTVTLPKSELLMLAASAEFASDHPIAKCVKAAAEGAKTPETCREIAGKGSIATVDHREVAVGNAALLTESGIAIPEDFQHGAGLVYVAVDGAFAGAISIADRVKDGAKTALEKLSALGARKTVILSGDRRENVEKIREELAIADARSGLLPNEKYEALEKIIAENGGKTVYVGDGINDAPSLARADVGVAMGGIGADSAIEAADLVIMSDSLEKLPEAILISRKTLRIAKENIVFALGVKLLILALGAFGIAGMWLAVFADVGVAVLAILNSMRTLSAAFLKKKTAK